MSCHLLFPSPSPFGAKSISLEASWSFLDLLGASRIFLQFFGINRYRFGWFSGKINYLMAWYFLEHPLTLSNISKIIIDPLNIYLHFLIFFWGLFIVLILNFCGYLKRNYNTIKIHIGVFLLFPLYKNVLEPHFPFYGIYWDFSEYFSKLPFPARNFPKLQFCPYFSLGSYWLLDFDLAHNNPSKFILSLLVKFHGLQFRFGPSTNKILIFRAGRQAPKIPLKFYLKLSGPLLEVWSFLQSPIIHKVSSIIISQNSEVQSVS